MKSILLAEDDKNFGTVLQKELEECGFSIRLVHDGVEAVLSFLAGSYNIVLMDIRMPRLNGIDTLRILKRINPRIPVITYSGNAESREWQESLEAGAAKCISKPFGMEALREDIQSCLSAAAPKAGS